MKNELSVKVMAPMLSLLGSILLTGCGSGVNASLDGSTEEHCQKDINAAFAKMTPRQQKVFNDYVANMQITSLYAKYGTTTPKKLVEGEANGEIAAAQKVMASISADFPAAAEMHTALGKFDVKNPEISYVPGEGGQLLAEISFDIANNSGSEFMCATNDTDGNFFAEFANMFVGNVPFKLEATIIGNDGKGISIRTSELISFGKKLGPDMCKAMPGPGKSIRLTWKSSLGEVGSELPTVDHFKRVGVKSLAVEAQNFMLFPMGQKAVPQPVFAKYLDSANTIVEAKQRIKDIQPTD